MVENLHFDSLIRSLIKAAVLLTERDVMPTMDSIRNIIIPIAMDCSPVVAIYACLLKLRRIFPSSVMNTLTNGSHQKSPGLPVTLMVDGDSLSTGSLPHLTYWFCTTSFKVMVEGSPLPCTAPQWLQRDSYSTDNMPQASQKKIIIQEQIALLWWMLIGPSIGEIGLTVINGFLSVSRLIHILMRSV